MAAAGGAAATVGSMQVVEEAIEETDLREATGCGALPTDGGMWQQLEQELECARLVAKAWVAPVATAWEVVVRVWVAVAMAWTVLVQGQAMRMAVMARWWRLMIARSVRQCCNNGGGE